MQNVLGVWAATVGVASIVVAVNGVQRPLQWFGLAAAFIAGLMLTLLIPRHPPETEVAARSIPDTFTASGIDFAWDACVKFIDSQLQAIERLDVKLGIVIAGLVSAAGVFFDRAHGGLAAVLGCISLAALLFSVLGFLLGGYRDTPDPHDVVGLVNVEARAAKIQFLDSFISSIDGNQVTIYRKGLLLHLAALLIFGVVVVATFAKAYSEIRPAPQATSKTNAPLKPAAH
jgi:hypothetical protein